MPDRPRDDDISAHITSIARSTFEERARLAQSLGAGGPVDRTEPFALPWVRRWRGRGPAPSLRLCGCAAGRCLICN